MSSSVARRRGAACLAIVGLLGVADAARAGLATATVHVETLGRSLAGAVAELQATDDPTLRWSRLAALDPAIERSAGDDPTARAGTVERLRDGPVLALFDPLPGMRQRSDLQAEAERDLGSAGARLHTLRAGLSVAHSIATTRTTPAAMVAETVAGSPARVCRYGTLGWESRWSSLEVGGYLADRVALASSLALDAGIRLDVARGSARGGSAEISWVNLVAAGHGPRDRVRARSTPRRLYADRRVVLGHARITESRPAGVRVGGPVRHHSPGTAREFPMLPCYTPRSSKC